MTLIALPQSCILPPIITLESACIRIVPVPLQFIHVLDATLQRSVEYTTFQHLLVILIH
jgi:hypothetical protein